MIVVVMVFAKIISVSVRMDTLVKIVHFTNVQIIVINKEAAIVRLESVLVIKGFLEMIVLR
jgi:hypothetical protein